MVDLLALQQLSRRADRQRLARDQRKAFIGYQPTEIEKRLARAERCVREKIKRAKWARGKPVSIALSRDELNWLKSVMRSVKPGD